MNEPNRFQLKRDYIVEELRRAIARGELKPGQRLRQEELAARFQISSTPVREALRRLEAEGLVTSVPHQGVCVARLSEAQIEERYRLGVLLEVYALQQTLSQLRHEPTRRQELLGDLEKYEAQMEAAQVADNTSELVELNARLHMRIYEEARSPLLKEMIADLWKRFAFSTFWFVPDRTSRALSEHTELLDALRREDDRAAEAILRHHIESGGREFLDRFRQLASAEQSQLEEVAFR